MQIRDRPAAVSGDESCNKATGEGAGKAQQVEGSASQKTCLNKHKGFDCAGNVVPRAESADKKGISRIV